MKKIYYSIIAMLVLTGVVFSGCSNPKSSQVSDVGQTSSADSQTDTSSQQATVEEEKERLVSPVMESKALQGSVVPQKTEQNVYVYLPPSYYKGEKAYPVVYYLHGYNESPSDFLRNNKSHLDTAFEAGAKEFIVVAVSGLNDLGGAFFANSPVSGNWEDYVVKDVVSFVDENYTTIKDSASRGICGFSMGGYGAYSIAFRHPDVFSAVLTMSPGLIADGEMEDAFASWSVDVNFKKAYAQAFSPNADNTDADTYGNIPMFSGTPEDNAIVTEWESGYGNINKRVDEYVALKKPLKAIKIMYGKQDSYSWIPKGCEFLSESLKRQNIEHLIEGADYGHAIPFLFVKNHMTTFFNANLAY